MRRVLVTGAAGQVGSRVVRALLKRGYEVRGLVLPDDPAISRLDGLDIELMEGNLLDPEVAARAVDGVEAVIHTANLVSPLPGMSETEFFDNNVRSTFNIAKAAAERADKIWKFVHISSSSVYPNDSHIIATCYNPVDELHPLRPVGTYGLSKLLGEMIVRAISRESGLRFSIIRPTGICSGDAILGRWTVGFVCAILRIGQRNPKSALYMRDGRELWKELESMAPPHALCAVSDLEGRPWLQQPVDARDVAQGCVLAMENEAAAGEVFNVSAPKPIPFDEAARLISELTGEPVVEWKAPVRWVFDLDNTKARRMIGYSPRWGIREMVESALRFREGEEDYE